MSKWQIAIAGTLLVATFVAWLGPVGPLFEMVANARSQILIIAMVAFVAFAVLRAPQAAGLVLVVVLINGYYLAPFLSASFPNSTDASQPTTVDTAVTVLQYNIFYNNENTDAIVDHILAYDADIAVIHELLPSQWDALAPALTKQYPYFIAEPFRAETGQLSGGMAILAKAPLDRLPVDAEASPQDRVLLVAESELHGHPITVVGLHPHASRFESRKIALRNTQIDAVVDIVDDTEGPIIVASDLNVTPTSPTYQDFLSRAGWADPHQNAGWHPTWPTWGSQLGFPIDHVFVSNEMRVESFETGHGAGSDHRSLVATIEFVDQSPR